MQIGDKVHWTKTSARGRQISMQRIDGVIVALTNDVATVKRASGLHTNIHVDSLRLDGEPGKIEEMMNVIRKQAER